MNCPSCGNLNNEGSKFCIKCGTPLATVQVSVPQTAEQQKIPSAPQNNVNSTSSKFNVINVLINMLLKPAETVEKESQNLENTKNALIISVIISGVMMLITLFTIIFNTVYYYDYYTGKSQFAFSNLKYVKFLNLIFKNFFVYMLLIFAVSGIYYLGSLIVKKNIKFFKTVSITSISLIPLIGCSMILSPIFGHIWGVLSFIFSIVGVIYTIVLIYELMNSEIKLEGNMKVYFNAAIISIILISIYYLSINVLSTSIISGVLGL